MSTGDDTYEKVLERAEEHARSWLATLGTRRVAPELAADQLLPKLGGPLPEEPSDPVEVVDELARACEPGLMAMGSGRFFGWVIGGVLPAALGADWLVSAWDQNNAMRAATPATAAVEEAAGGWILELLGLPREAEVGFTTGAMMANFTGLAAARSDQLARQGWDVARDGIIGAPRLRVLVGEERHDSVDLALRYLGLGAPEAVATDDQGRIRSDALAEALSRIGRQGPVIVCLQAGNVHSGAFDPFVDAIPLAHEHGAWVHVDGAFGLWAAAAPPLQHLVVGLDGADSWATDAHKTLNVPYDCGIAVVADKRALAAALRVDPHYALSDASGRSDPFNKVPEFSRRARGVPAWAALRSLGRRGVADLVARLAANAKAMAEGLADLPGAEVLNDVVYTQVCLAFGDDETTRAVTAQLIADGSVWMSGSKWRGRDVLRVSVSNWSTDDDDVRFSVEAVRRALSAATA